MCMNRYTRVAIFYKVLKNWTPGSLTFDIWTDRKLQTKLFCLEKTRRVRAPWLLQWLETFRAPGAPHIMKMQLYLKLRNISLWWKFYPVSFFGKKDSIPFVNSRSQTPASWNPRQEQSKTSPYPQTLPALLYPRLLMTLGQKPHNCDEGNSLTIPSSEQSQLSRISSLPFFTSGS